MNGAKYNRLSLGLSMRKVCKDTGICMPTIAKVEAVMGAENVGGIYPEIYLKLREYYHVSVDDLLRNDYPERTQRHKPVGSAAENAGNPITVYRHVNDLTLRDMGLILGVCYETVRKLCMQEAAPVEYIRILAARSGLCEEEFTVEYGGENNGLA